MVPQVLTPDNAYRCRANTRGRNKRNLVRENSVRARSICLDFASAGSGLDFLREESRRREQAEGEGEGQDGLIGAENFPRGQGEYGTRAVRGVGVTARWLLRRHQILPRRIARQLLRFQLVEVLHEAHFSVYHDNLQQTGLELRTWA